MSTRLGTFVLAFSDDVVGTLASAAGAEFVIVDTEHTGWDWGTVRRSCMATQAAGASPWVKVPSVARESVTRALDAGARGLLVPLVDSADQARQVASWARYPPDGTRGSAFYALTQPPAPGEAAEYARRENNDVVVMAMIESAAAVAAVADIAAVEGVDGLWLGHYDLTLDLGIPGAFDHADYIRARDEVVAAAARHGKAMGQAAGSVAEIKMLAESGFTHVAYSNDIALYRDSLRAALHEFTTQT